MVIRNSLPKDLITNIATVLDNFSEISTWSVESGGTIALDTEITNLGDNSLAITNTTAGTSAKIIKTCNFNLSVSNYFEINIYIPNLSVYNGCTIYLFNSNNNNYFQRSIPFPKQGWNRVRVYKKDFTVGGGTPLWDLPITKFKIVIGVQAGIITTYNISTIKCNQKSMPKTVFTFDDGYTSVYTIAFPYMKARKIKGTVFVISSSVGNTNYMTLAQLTELHNDGWVISNHTSTHQQLATLTRSQQKEEIKTCQDWLIYNGFSNGANYIAFPFGSYNVDTLSVCAELGIKVARTTNNGINDAPIINLFETNNVAYDTTISIANLKSLYVEKGLNQGSTIIPMLHAIESSTSQAYNITISNFQTMIDYHVLRKTDNLTIDEWYKQLTNPRKLISRL